MPKKNRLCPILRGLLAIIGMAVLLVSLPVLYVNAVGEAHTYTDVTQTPAEPVAIVFGAGITANRSLTPMLADRVYTSVQLYRLGHVRQLLMTGDGSSAQHNEVDPMRRYAEARGVPRQNVILDYAGFSTYESCYRARAVFGVTRAVLITQQYHLPRALYLCRHLGIDAVGIGTRDWGVYPDGLMTAYSIREVPAIFKALWQVHVTRPTPTYLGPKEGLHLDWPKESE